MLRGELSEEEEFWFVDTNQIYINEQKIFI